jgi:hypothetical protein
MRGTRNAQKILIGKYDGNKPLERHSVDGRIILK